MHFPSSDWAFINHSCGGTVGDSKQQPGKVILPKWGWELLETNQTIHSEDYGCPPSLKNRAFCNWQVSVFPPILWGSTLGDSKQQPASQPEQPAQPGINNSEQNIMCVCVFVQNPRRLHTWRLPARVLICQREAAKRKQSEKQPCATQRKMPSKESKS